MDKLLELEKKLKEARAMLEKQAESTCKSDDEEDELSQSEKDKKKKKNPDEKEDAELGEEVEHAVEEHMKDHPKKEKEEGHEIEFKKGLGSKLDNAEHKNRVSQALGSIRLPAKVTDASGKTKEVSAKEQVSQIKSVKADKASAAKEKAEAEAAARRAQYKKEGLIKSDEEQIKFNSWGQWDL